MKFKQVDILASTKVTEAELTSDIKVELAVLKGLDIFTDAHVQGVAKTTLTICQKMNMSYADIKRHVLAAYLHDIGKIKIPPEILQKNGRLTEEEFSEIKKHTIYGYEICMEYKNFKEYAPIVRAHHENLDGTGYPDGLKSEEIPEEAKLIKVADVYDALTKRRQYKEGYKQSEALKLMLEDVKNGKTACTYFEALLEAIAEDLNEKKDVHENNVRKYKGNIEILHELEAIYKQIYDNGYSKKLERRLQKFELEPGYDMSVNANLLIVKQKAMEKEMEWLEICISEIKEISKIINETRKIKRVQ